MKRLLSASTIGIMVVTIILGLIILDYKVLRKRTGLRSSSLISTSKENKVYNVDTMAIVLEKIDNMTTKVERLNNIVEKLLKTKGSKEKRSSNGLFRKKNNVPFKFDFFNNPNAKEKYPFGIRNFEKQINSNKFDSNGHEERKESVPYNPFKGLFSLTKMVKDFNGIERKRKKDREEQSDLNPPINDQNKGIQSKNDVLQAVKKKFPNVVDLTPTDNEESKKTKDYNSNINESPLFFQPANEIGKTPFDNIANLTDFSSSISSTIIKSTEVPDENNKTKKKITSQINLNIENQPIKEEKNMAKDLFKHRADADTLVKSAKLEDPLKKEEEKTTNKSKISDTSLKMDGFTADKPFLGTEKINSNKNDTTEKPTKNINSFKELVQSEKDRLVEQNHLEKEKEKENPLIKDFALVEKEFNEKHGKLSTEFQPTTIIIPTSTISQKDTSIDNPKEIQIKETPKNDSINNKKDKSTKLESLPDLNKKPLHSNRHKTNNSPSKPPKKDPLIDQPVDSATPLAIKNETLKTNEENPTKINQDAKQNNLFKTALFQFNLDNPSKKLPLENENNGEISSSSSDTHDFSPTSENGGLLVGSKI